MGQSRQSTPLSLTWESAERPDQQPLRPLTLSWLPLHMWLSRVSSRGGGRDAAALGRCRRRLCPSGLLWARAACQPAPALGSGAAHPSQSLRLRGGAAAASAEQVSSQVAALLAKEHQVALAGDVDATYSNHGCGGGPEGEDKADVRWGDGAQDASNKQARARVDSLGLPASTHRGRTLVSCGTRAVMAGWRAMS